MGELTNSVSELSSVGSRVITLLYVVGFAGFVYLAYHAYRLRQTD